MADRTDPAASRTAPPRGADDTASGGGAASGPAGPGSPGGARPRAPRFAGLGLAAGFLLPALLFLGTLVVYPLLSTFVRSLFDSTGSTFVGVRNYVDMFASPDTLTAIKNNAIWMVAAPSIVTALGLIFAVLSERIRWTAAFKFVVFVPMVISMLAAGVIFRLVYDADPDKGVLNAIAVGVHDSFAEPARYAGARPRPGSDLVSQAGGLATARPLRPGSVAQVPLVGVRPAVVPASAVQAQLPPPPAPDAITGVVWLDFSPGGGGRPNVLDPSEKGLPSVKVQAVRDGTVVASATTDVHGVFTLRGLAPGEYGVRLPSANFAPPFRGVTWLGPSLVTPAIIGAYVWMWAGFAMVLIAAGLAAIPREALEAARVDGATEWQVFRRVTVPLLSPVLVVVLVTLVINVLKIFDLVLVLAPGSSQDDANVLAFQMWRTSFGAQPDQGLGSALAIFLFLLVVPAMLFNIRRFRQERS